MGLATSSCPPSCAARWPRRAHPCAPVVVEDLEREARLPATDDREEFLGGTAVEDEPFVVSGVVLGHLDFGARELDAPL